MPSNTDKLTIKLGDATAAAALVAAGLTNPTAIRAASDNAIEEAVGSENLSAVRTVFAAPQ